ncbi:ABC transporter permease [Bacillus benzoevorans]|uniref:ABC-2 type transport system permease protein n=1 Tax=Bacillus benzoevorans TaxID=1456 RepID=A0A7X0HMT9_9BACI|nr:ABC transporter permease [Bacillus benzoevorans]MBB6443476.1 ABC-2 type transport system permease protein [Bacillus benzoevorans]
MFDEKLLWKERFSRTSRELSRYLRYIFNGHLVIVLVFLLGSAAYYYQEWLKVIPDNFPAAIIMAAAIAFLLTLSPIFTFMSEADRIFLIPLETSLNGYFKKSLFISFTLQLYLLVIGLAVLMPLYAAVNNGDFKSFFYFLAAVIVVKYVNLLLRWHVQYYQESTVLKTDSLIRFCVNLVFLYLLFSNAPLYFTIVPFVILLGLYMYYKGQTKGKGLKWEFLIKQDEKRMTSFYRLANLFTDVPKLKSAVKRREWLDFLLAKIPFQQDQTFTYLLARTFLRSGDYFGLLLRLTIIGAGALYFLAFGIGQVVLVVLFLYLTGFQLLPLWKHHQYHSPLELYPISSEEKERSFLSLLRIVLFIQTVFLSAAVLAGGQIATAAISLIAGIIFTVYFISLYSQRKIKNG